MNNQVELIKAEIKRRIEINKYADTPGYLKEDKALLQFINTLPQELVSEELEEAAKNCQENLYDGYYSGHIKGYQQAFIAGANWQKEQLYKQAEQHLEKKTNGEILLEDTVAFDKGFKLGKSLNK